MEDLVVPFFPEKWVGCSAAAGPGALLRKREPRADGLVGGFLVLKKNRVRMPPTAPAPGVHALTKHIQAIELSSGKTTRST